MVFTSLLYTCAFILILFGDRKSTQGSENSFFVDVFKSHKPPVKTDLLLSYKFDIFEALVPENFYKTEKQFHSVLTNLLQTVRLHSLTEVLHQRDKFNQKFNYSVPLSPMPMTSQERSGRCWIFAFLNMLRCRFAKVHDLAAFEFSQSHFMYWMTIERLNMYFVSLVRLMEQGVSMDTPIFRQLVGIALSDGGTWSMALNVLNKYGLMPKSKFPETVSSSNTFQLREILQKLLVLHTDRIEKAVHKRNNIDPLEAVKEAVSEVQGFVTLAYGVPPEKFTWFPPKCANKKAWTNITAIEFYKLFVKPSIDPNEMITLVSDDRPTLKMGQGYIVQLAGLFAEQSSGFTCNVNQEDIEESIVESIKKGMPVWISIDFNRFRSTSQSLLDLNVHDYTMLNGMKYPFLNRTNRNSFRSSTPNHAVLLTEVAVDSKDKPLYYKIENSHGLLGEGKGFLLMTRDWFREYGYEAVVIKSALTKQGKQCLSKASMLLPVWDCLAATVF